MHTPSLDIDPRANRQLCHPTVIEWPPAKAVPGKTTVTTPCHPEPSEGSPAAAVSAVTTIVDGESLLFPVAQIEGNPGLTSVYRR